MTTTIHGGKAIVDSLELHGVERVFLVPGESYLSVLDGLYDSSIKTIVCRHEAACTYMADAHGKFTGKPGIAMVTRGPGAAQAFTGIHTAWQDGVPLILFVGLIPSSHTQKESFQEFDPHQWFSSQCKEVLILDDVNRASELVARAFHAALSGRPGPVVVGLPEDTVEEIFKGEIHPIIPVAKGSVTDEEVNEIQQALAKAKKPLIIAGGQNWTAKASKQLTHFAETNQIPVMHEWRAADRIPFLSPAHAGYLGYGRSEKSTKILEAADLLLIIGTVLGDVISDGFELRQAFNKTNYIVNLDTSLRGHSGAVTHHILATPKSFMAKFWQSSLAPDSKRGQWFRECHQNQKQDSEFTISEGNTQSNTDHVADDMAADMTLVMKSLVTHLPKDAVYNFGAGNHCIWAQKYLHTNVFPSQISTRNGAMGYSIPAGIASALAAPERLSVVISGDGEFMMNEAEISTAIRYQAPILIIVVDNGQYGTIREHQETFYPQRVSGTQLKNPDFASLVNAFGGVGFCIKKNDEIEEIIKKAIHLTKNERKITLVHVITDPQQLSP